MRVRGAVLALLAVLVLASPFLVAQAAGPCAEEAGDDGDCEIGCALCLCCPRALSSSTAACDPVAIDPSSEIEPEPPVRTPGPVARELLHVPWPHIA